MTLHLSDRTVQRIRKGADVVPKDTKAQDSNVIHDWQKFCATLQKELWKAHQDAVAALVDALEPKEESDIQDAPFALFQVALSTVVHF